MRAPALSIAAAVAAATGVALGTAPAIGLEIGAVAVVGAAVIIGVSADRVAYLAVALSVLVMNWNGIRFGGGAVADAFLVAAFAAVLALVIVEKRLVPFPTWMLIASVGLVVAALLTIVFPPNEKLVRSTLLVFAEETSAPTIFPVRSDLSALLKFEIAWLVLPLMITLTASTRKRCIRLLDLFVISAVISGAVAVLNFIVGGPAASGAIAADRAVGLTLHSNYLAFNSVVALPVALLWFTRGRRWAALAPLAVAALLGAVYASGSRAGSLSAVVAVFATLIAVRQLRPGLRVVIPALGIAVMVIVLFTRIGQHILEQVRLNPGNTTAAASDSQRSAMLEVTFQQIRSRPLQGVGFAVIQDAQNLYLQLLAAGGVIAFVSFAIYIGGLVGAAKNALRGVLRPEATAAAVSISVWLLHGFLDAPLVDKYLYVIPGVLLAMSYLAVRSDVPREVPFQRGERPWTAGGTRRSATSLPMPAGP